MTAVEGDDQTVHRRTLSPRGITGVCVAVAVAAAAATVAAGLLDGSSVLVHPVSFLVLTLLLAYTHVRPTRLVHRYGSVDSDHLDEAVFVPMVLMLSSFEVAVAIAVASLAGNLAARRAPVKVAFNVGQTVLAGLAGWMVAAAGGAPVDKPVTDGALAACLAGGVVFAGVSSLAVACIVRLAAGHPALAGMWEQWRSRGVASFGALLLGLIAGAAVRDHLILAVPAIALGWSVEQAYVAIVAQRQARRAAETLQATVIAIRNASTPETIRARLAEAATEVLHAGTATFVRPGTAAPSGALWAKIDDETALQVSDRVGGGAWLPGEREALTTLASVGGEALQNARLVAQLTAVTDGQSEGVLVIDASGLITFANPAARELLTGSAEEEVVERRAEEVFSIHTAQGRVDWTALSGSHGQVRDRDAQLRAAERRIPVWFTASGLPAPQTGVVVVVHDITEQKSYEQKLTYLAFHDALTDLPNRRLFEDRLDHALVRGTRYQMRHALLVVDLDRFKLVNDSYGHPAGDELLVQVAGVLRRALRPEDTCARMGGDEFAILIEDVKDTQQIVDVAERVLALLAEGCIVEGYEVYVSASIGIATSDQVTSSAALVAAADHAGYQAKATGKGRYAFYSPDTAADPRARLELEAALRRALDEGQFELYYQPVVETDSGETVGVEALVRWNSADGLVMPKDFIPLAEETGLIHALGEWVLEQACRQGHAWTVGHPELPPLEVSVNLSAQQLSRPNIVSAVHEVLVRTGLRPEQLCLEITETAIMSDTESAASTLLQLKEAGLRVAIDDFGTGYSSLSYLKRLPLDIVKIDQTFTSGIGKNPVDSEIVAAVVRLAAASGIEVIAEGVETREQRVALDQLGCPLIQGFLIAKPLPADRFEEFWTSQASTAI